MLSGRNDWVATTNDNHIGVGQSREDSKFSGRAGLIYNFDFGLAPYVSYATSYNPVIGLNSGQLLLPETGQQTEVGFKFQPDGFNGHIGLAWFDLKRQNALTIRSDTMYFNRPRAAKSRRAVSNWKPSPISPPGSR